MCASILRSVLAACLLGAAVYALTAGGASGQQYQLAQYPLPPPPPPPPPPPANGPLPKLKPFPVVRIRGVATRRGARISSLTVRARVGVTILSRCKGKANRCPYKQRTRRIKGTAGKTRTRHVNGFERGFRAGVMLRLFVIAPTRTGKYTSFTIRRLKRPRRKDRCVRGFELKPIRLSQMRGCKSS